MTLDELYNHILTIVADHRTEYTESEKRRAIQIFLGIDEYLTDAFGEVYWNEDSLFEDFGDYASKQLDILENNK